MQEIDEVVSLIGDGQWHGLKEIGSKSRLPKPIIGKILEFLANYCFVHFDSQRKTVRITPSLSKFLKETRTD